VRRLNHVCGLSAALADSIDDKVLARLNALEKEMQRCAHASIASRVPNQEPNKPVA